MAYSHTNLLVLFLSLLILLPLFKVQGQPDWVKKTMKENRFSESSYEAPAVVLLNKTLMKVIDNGVAHEKVQRVTKILKPQGTGYADLEITTTPYRKVKDIKGWHIDQAGFCRKLESKNIREINLSQITDFYDDDMVLTAGFSGVVAGDVVAYEYEINIDDSLKDNYYVFTLQHSLPVMETYLEVAISDGWRVQISGNNLSPLTFREENSKYIWEGQHLAYYAEEPYMPSWSV